MGLFLPGWIPTGCFHTKSRDERAVQVQVQVQVTDGAGDRTLLPICRWKNSFFDHENATSSFSVQPWGVWTVDIERFFSLIMRKGEERRAERKSERLRYAHRCFQHINKLYRIRQNLLSVNHQGLNFIDYKKHEAIYTEYSVMQSSQVWGQNFHFHAQGEVKYIIMTSLRIQDHFRILRALHLNDGHLLFVALESVQ